MAASFGFGFVGRTGLLSGIEGFRVDGLCGFAGIGGFGFSAPDGGGFGLLAVDGGEGGGGLGEVGSGVADGLADEEGGGGGPLPFAEGGGG